MNTLPGRFHDLLVRDPAAAEAIQALVCRMELWPQLLRRQQEEQIAGLVPIESSWLQECHQDFLAGEPLEDVLQRRRWTEQDLHLHLLLPEALRRFSEQRFGPGLEELFLASQGGHDQIIYSLLRVRDAGVARELWIRLEEGEASFAELASSFGEGPEAARKGVIGPIPIGNITPPELANLLRSLQPGEVHPPRQLGDWLVLVRLEQLTPARFDGPMREFLLTQQLDAFLQGRVEQLLRGEQPDELHYDPTS